MKRISNLELPARLDHLYKFRDFVASFAAQQGFADPISKKIELCLEEALANIFCYAYEDTIGNVVVECLFEDNRLTIKVIDSGVPFNPLEVNSPDVHANIASNRIGGYGVVLIKKLTDEVRYAREEGKNVLTMVFVQHDDKGKDL